MGKQRVLVVDDEQQFVRVIQIRLEANDYEVITASDGQEGLEKAQTEQPDIIILDLMMPRLDGYEVCARLKQDARYRHIPIVLLTADTNPIGEQIARARGANAYLQKPSRSAEMLATLHTLLAAAAPPDAAPGCGP